MYEPNYEPSTKDIIKGILISFAIGIFGMFGDDQTIGIMFLIIGAFTSLIMLVVLIQNFRKNKNP